MKIDSIEIHRVGMPLIYPFRTSYGNDDRIESVLVKMHSGGLYGWGEATPWQSPGYSSECAKTAFLVARDFLAPLLLGEDIPDGKSLQKHLSPFKGNNFAKAAFDLAWWDLASRCEERPLHRMIGGTRPTVEVGADFGVMESVKLLLETIEDAVNKGFKRIKLKFRPGWDLNMISAVRTAFPEIVVHVDCNSAYTLDDIEMFRTLDDFGLSMIEQPLMHDDLIDHAALQKELHTPICLDESITSPSKARKAIQIKACGWINIKPGRVGGLTPAIEIHDICHTAGIPCWVGGMLESSVGGHHCLALASLPNFTYPGDLFPSDRFYHNDLSHPPMKLSGPSEMEMPNVPGCGAEPDAQRLHQNTLEHASLPFT